ncbi:MAG TPA: DUF1553 domain-containing protein [Tepidisphaeraceae bacterium]|jgi:hypothetical protein|nr:DUF1553 domain-containing protein [Tepidisphaeraceae bacterium]
MRLHLLSCLILALALGAAPATQKSDSFRDEHKDLDARTQRPDKQVSDLTKSVAAKLPHIGSETRDLPRRNLIDEHLFDAMEKANIPHASLSSDEEFCRRIYLDLTGRIPTTEQLLAFVQSQATDKRDRLIDELLDSQAWVDHWGYWYGDLFRNCANRIGNPATRNFDQWFRGCLKEDRPYDQIVAEMLTASAPNSIWMPDSAPSAFLARWHVPGDTMYSDRYEDTADEVIVQSSRLFLGINYQCISCHGGKGFLERVNLDLVSKKRSELWAMAAFFGRMRIRIVPFQDRFTITEDGTGYDAAAPSSVRMPRKGADLQPTFILSGEVGNPNKPLRPQFAQLLTRHPQFARATVNLIWKQFFGLGIVDPVDSFDMARQDPAHPPPSPWTVQPTNPALLNALGRDFAENRFSLKHLMRQMARSSAYQLSSHFDGEWKESYTPYFSRHYVRMLTAEQLHDAICQATLVFGNYKHKDMVYKTDLPPFRFWTEAPTPEEIGDGEAKSILRTFGQANREQFDRQSGGSILQAMTLMNSPFVNKRIRAENNSRVEQLVKSDKTSTAIVDELYLATLSRRPRAQEKELAITWLDADRKQGAEDLQWSLLNKLDFIFNY